jgi:hypothetical protein
MNVPGGHIQDNNLRSFHFSFQRLFLMPADRGSFDSVYAGCSC